MVALRSVAAVPHVAALLVGVAAAAAPWEHRVQSAMRLAAHLVPVRTEPPRLLLQPRRLRPHPQLHLLLHLPQRPRLPHRLLPMVALVLVPALLAAARAALLVRRRLPLPLPPSQLPTPGRLS